MPGGDKSYSPLGGMRDKIRQVAGERLSRLRDNDIKAVITWLEAEQLEASINTSLEDDPVENAKGRGKVEFITYLNGHLFGMLGARAQAAKGPTLEEEDDDE